MKDKLKTFILSFMTLLSFIFLSNIISSKYDLYNFFKLELLERGLINLFLLVIIYYFYKNNTKKEYNNRLKKISSVGSILYTFLIIIGDSFVNTNSLALSSKTEFIIFIIKFIGLYNFIKIILEILITKITTLKIKKTKEKTKFKTLCDIYHKHPIIFVFILLLICYLPYIIIFYPGTMNMDSLFEIEQFYGKAVWTKHHPIFPTIFYGLLMKLGRAIINDNFGLFLSNIIQLCISSLIISYSINYIYKLTKNKLFRNILIIIFAFYPIWPINFYTCVKDIWFSLAFLLFIISTIKYYESKDNFSKLDWFIYSISIIFLILFRNNGIHVVILSIPFLYFLFQKEKRFKFIICTLICLIICISFDKICTNTLNIKNGSVRESLSIPLQQTSRYVMTYDLTKKEEKTINKLIDIDDIKENYNPETVDFVKANYKESASSKDRKEYFKIWFKMFFKHPITYVEATLNSTYGYYYPNKLEFKDNVAQFTIDAPDIVNVSNFSLKQIDKFYFVRDKFIKAIKVIRVIPIIGLFFNCGTYTWILIFDCLILIYKRKKEILLLAPLYLILLVCIASPVNALIRYMIPIMIALPFLQFWIYFIIKNEK